MNLKKQEIKCLNLIKYSKFKLKISTEKIKFKEPKYKIETCLLKNKTYSIQLLLPIQIKYNGHIVVKYGLKK